MLAVEKRILPEHPVIRWLVVIATFLSVPGSVVAIVLLIVQSPSHRAPTARSTASFALPSSPSQTTGTSTLSAPATQTQNAAAPPYPTPTRSPSPVTRTVDHPASRPDVSPAATLSPSTAKPTSNGSIAVANNSAQQSSPAALAPVTHVPTTALRRYFLPGHPGDHMTTIGVGPGNYQLEQLLGYVLTQQIPDTAPLYSCNVGWDWFTSRQSDCEGKTVDGLLGYVYADGQGSSTRLIRRCAVEPSDGGQWDHFDSGDAGCEGQSQDTVLGYVLVSQ
jgi:hypothetical protein